MKHFKIIFKKPTASLLLLTILVLIFIVACKKKPLITWEKTYGGGSRDRAYSIQQASDKGYFVAAQSSSFSAGGYDYYIIKLDELGEKLWEKTFGGESAEIPRSIKRTNDGGCIVAGRTSSFSPGYCDFYIVKIDQNGNKNWEKVYGGDSWDDPWSIQQTADGGYAVAGFTESIGAGGYDVYILKLDSNGNRVWEKTFGGALADAANSIQQTADGGYVVAGFTESIGDGGRDAYIMKLDGSGEQIWEKTFGSILDDEAFSIHQNNDNSYTFAGYISSGGATDVYLARLDESGNIRWERTFGESGEDKAYAVQQTTDGGFIVAGYVHPDDAIAEYDDDIYLLKLNRTGELNQ